MNRLPHFFLFALLAVSLAACRGESLPDNESLETAFAQGRTGVWLSGHGTVVRELVGDATSQRFQVRVSPGLSIVLRHSVQDAGRVPAERGDTIAFHGLYEFHGGGGEISLTHADSDRPGGGGWILHRGIRYD
ncbi:MAG: DUF3465 domain-containing protein [Wenzhouxiangella sp.]|nr:MAG: DUF3465 domain-containing protein [Wenzhouxiangella sp.]